MFGWTERKMLLCVFSLVSITTIAFIGLNAMPPSIPPTPRGPVLIAQVTQNEFQREIDSRTDGSKELAKQTEELRKANERFIVEMGRMGERQARQEERFDMLNNKINGVLAALAFVVTYVVKNFLSMLKLRSKPVDP
jgi:hypothetical protein